MSNSPSRLASLAPRRLVPALIFVASLGILILALGSEHIGGLRPCVLCHYQRAAYAAAAMLSGCALALAIGERPQPGWSRLLVGLCALAFLIGAGVAFNHVGVEQHWWLGVEGCTVPAPGSAATVEELRARLMAAPLVPCDKIQWSLFGLSLAAYNVIGSLALAAATLYGLRLIWPNEER